MLLPRVPPPPATVTIAADAAIAAAIVVTADSPARMSSPAAAATGSLGPQHKLHESGGGMGGAVRVLRCQRMPLTSTSLRPRLFDVATAARPSVNPRNPSTTRDAACRTAPMSCPLLSSAAPAVRCQSRKSRQSWHLRVGALAALALSPRLGRARYAQPEPHQQPSPPNSPT